MLSFEATGDSAPSFDAREKNVKRRIMNIPLLSPKPNEKNQFFSSSLSPLSLPRLSFVPTQRARPGFFFSIQQKKKRGKENLFRAFLLLLLSILYQKQTSIVVVVVVVVTTANDCYCSVNTQEKRSCCLDCCRHRRVFQSVRAESSFSSSITEQDRGVRQARCLPLTDSRHSNPFIRRW